MPRHRTLFGRFVLEDLRRRGAPDPDLLALLNDLQRACRLIGGAVARGPTDAVAPQTGVNTHGEIQKPMDVIANKIVISSCEPGGQLCGMVSEELEEAYVTPAQYPRGPYMLVFDPLDGSSNLDINMTVGTIFSILRAPPGVEFPTAGDFLQSGTEQVAAGFAIYGPTSMLVITLGEGTHGFTLHREAGIYVLTHPNMRIPEAASEFAINSSNARFWEPPVRRYVEECVLGKEGPREADFNMRWIACLVAEVHRILVRGGVFLYPRDTKDPNKQGRLRLLYEANPMAMIIEQAGGGASTGRARILELEPTDIHQRIPVILGSRLEVERLVAYHQAYDLGEPTVFETPLFNTRSLFRTA